MQQSPVFPAPQIAGNQLNYKVELVIVIVNYNTSRLLQNCLNSVFASKTTFDWRVIVVDNNSSDDSVEMVRREFENRLPNLTLIANRQNGGYAFGNNLALRQVCPFPDTTNIYKLEQKSHQLHIGSLPEARFILLLNPDTVVPEDAFQKMYDFMNFNPDVGIVGPKLVKGNGKLDLACRRSFPTPSVSLWRMTGLSKLFPRHPLFGKYNLTFLDPDTLTEVDSVCGAFMWIRAEAIQQAGILDEAYFMYGEDLDWAFRIKEKGWKVFYNPATTVLHYKGESSKQRSTGAIINFYQAMLVFYRSHYAPRTFFLLNWIIISGIYLKGTLALARNIMRPKERRRVS